MAHLDPSGSLEAPVESAPEAIRWPQPGELWSLWDMIDLSPRTLVFIGERMEEFRSFWNTLESGGGVPASEEEQAALRWLLRRIKELAEALDMPRSVVNAFDVAHTTALPKSHERLHTLFCLFKDEIKSSRAMVLSPKQCDLYQLKEPFGPKVSTKFRAVADEIERAAQCLALEQPTACVFHLMRAMESVVQVLAAKLGVQNLEREWGKLLSDMDIAIRAMPKGPEANEWSMARSNLYHVKQACRNDTMHPKKSYTTEQASEVFTAMKALMSHLSDLM